MMATKTKDKQEIAFVITALPALKTGERVSMTIHGRRYLGASYFFFEGKTA